MRISDWSSDVCSSDLIGDSIVVGKAPELRTIGNDDFRDTGVQELRTRPAIPQVEVAELFAPTERIDTIPWHPQLDIPSRRSAEDAPRPAANLLTPRHGTGGTQREGAYMEAKARRSLRRIENPRFLRDRKSTRLNSS